MHVGICMFYRKLDLRVAVLNFYDPPEIWTSTYFLGRRKTWGSSCQNICFLHIDIKLVIFYCPFADLLVGYSTRDSIWRVDIFCSYSDIWLSKSSSAAFCKDIFSDILLNSKLWFVQIIKLTLQEIDISLIKTLSVNYMDIYPKGVPFDPYCGFISLRKQAFCFTKRIYFLSTYCKIVL